MCKGEVGRCGVVWCGVVLVSPGDIWILYCIILYCSYCKGKMIGSGNEGVCIQPVGSRDGWSGVE